MSDSGKLDFGYLKIPPLLDDEQQSISRVKPLSQKKRLRKIQESESETEQYPLHASESPPPEKDDEIKNMEA